MPSDIIKVTRAFLRHVTENAVCEEDRALRAALDALPGNVIGYAVVDESGDVCCRQSLKESAVAHAENMGYTAVALLAVPVEDIESHD